MCAAMSNPGPNETAESSPHGTVRSSTHVWKQVSTLFQEVAPWYEKIGPGGFLIVSGSVISIVTIILSFLTGTDDDGSVLGISLEEEIAFLLLGSALCVMGILSVRWKNSLISQEKMKVVELQMLDNQLLIEQKTKRLEILSAMSKEGQNVSVEVRNLARDMIHQELE